jgi:hypothetical protein
MTVFGNYPTESVFAFRKPSIGRSEIIRSVFTPTHRAAKTAGLIVERALDDEYSPPELPMGFDPQETFTQHDEACYV